MPNLERYTTNWKLYIDCPNYECDTNQNRVLKISLLFASIQLVCCLLPFKFQMIFSKLFLKGFLSFLCFTLILMLFLIKCIRVKTSFYFDLEIQYAVPYGGKLIGFCLSSWTKNSSYPDCSLMQHIGSIHLLHHLK